MPDLFPRPRSLALDGGSSTAPVEEVADRSLPAQGYVLSIGPERAVLAHADAAGLRYGRDTVAQLRSADGSLPTGEVRDHPAIATRGVMLDVSRDRVPTRATLDRLVGIMVAARCNHLQLYVEHTFAYAGHEDVWRDASPLTAADLRWLDDRCAEHGIELAANQNCFGHMGRWLAHDRYRDRAECPDGVEILPGVIWPPGVLAPTADNAAFVVELVREQRAAVRSRVVNVGCDETFELGRGASADRVAEVGLGTVYGEHLARIVGPLLADGAAVQVWADVLAHHPEALDLLPAGEVTALVWNYDRPGAPTPDLPASVAGVLADLGIDLTTPTDFETRLVPFAGGSRPAWVVPGTSSWNSLVGRLDDARANLLDAARAAVAAGVDGYLITDWGDGGHHQPPSVSDPPILYGAAVAWGPEANADLDLAATVDRIVHGVAVTGGGVGTAGSVGSDGSPATGGAPEADSGSIGRVLQAVGGVHGRTGVVARNLSPLVAALFPDQVHLTGGTPDRDAVAEVVATLDRARDDLARARSTAADAADVVEELDVAIGLARHGALRMAARAEGRDPDGDAAAMHADLAPLIDRYRAAWSARARPGGLADSAARIERTLAHYAPR